MLRKADGTLVTMKNEIEQKIMEFYGSLMGTNSHELAHIDIQVMRDVKQLSWDQRLFLKEKVTMQEIETSLKGIGDLKSPGIDGYGARFFKASYIIKDDVVTAIQDFFNHGDMYRKFNQTVVTLIPKHNVASSIKDYRPIAGCSTFYKIIARILTARLGKFMQGTISLYQASFIPGQQIHNHIMLAYEIIKGYGRKHGTPRCMMQLDLQKSYDMMDWRALKCIMMEMGIPNRFID